MLIADLLEPLSLLLRKVYCALLGQLAVQQRTVNGLEQEREWLKKVSNQQNLPMLSAHQQTINPN